jgi:hypothetical protein
VLDFLADGSNWIRGSYNDGDGRRCLVGAVVYLGRAHHLPSWAALSFLREAIPNRQFPPVYFNDRHCSSVAKLRSVIVKARCLALREAELSQERERTAAVLERRLLAEVKEERAVRATGPNG